MSAVLTKTVIFDQRMYANTGLVGKWVTKVTFRFTAEARRAAPIRSGELKARINGSTARTGERMFDGYIESGAAHTMYVIGGTSTPIYSKAAWAAGGNLDAAFEIRRVEGKNGRTREIEVGRRGFWLAVGKRPWPPIQPKFAVAGQRPNNFLFTAWRRTAADHRAIRGKLPGGFPGL